MVTRGRSGKSAVARDLIADRLDGSGARAALAPDRADAAARHGFGEWDRGHAAGRAVSAAAGEQRQQRDADASGNHLPQRLDAGGAEILFFAYAAAGADGKRLV